MNMGEKGRSISVERKRIKREVYLARLRAGESPYVIAVEPGAPCDETLRKWCVKHQIPYTRKTGGGVSYVSPEQKAKALECFERGVPIDVTAVRVGFSQFQSCKLYAEFNPKSKMRGKLLNAEDRILAHLRANPSSSREAATALDISPKSVRRVARKHNIKLFAGGNVRYSTQVKSDCLQALKDGISKESISERYGVTISSLKSWAYMAKITLKYKARNNQYTVERSQPKQVETEAPEFVAMRKEYSRAMASQRWFGGLGA